MTPISKQLPIFSDQATPSGAWVLFRALIGPSGNSLGPLISTGQMPAACPTNFVGGYGVRGRCLAAHGFHQLVTHQPDSRFWAFQGIEAGIFVVLAAALVGFTVWRVLSRDA